MLWLLQVVALADLIVVWSRNVQDFSREHKNRRQPYKLRDLFLSCTVWLFCVAVHLCCSEHCELENVLFMAQIWNISVFYFPVWLRLAKFSNCIFLMQGFKLLSSLCLICVLCSELRYVTLPYILLLNTEATVQDGSKLTHSLFP